MSSNFNFRKYTANARIPMPSRQWPDRQITSAPQWCSVDLRDGNQALPKPMNPAQKMRFFHQLVEIGFKEIEVGFPAASQPDFDFVRELIEGGHIPDDVTIQILTQAREDIIARSFEALRGAPRAIVHLYYAASPAQRRYVFNIDKAGARASVEQGARWVQQNAAAQPDTRWTFQYSPESFTQTAYDTEPELALELCTAVCDIWRPDQGQPVIINLPSTVESQMPNAFADRIEWFGNHFSYRGHVRLSVHPHNDRGCGVACGEMSVLAGADRVEGTLLGNGERTGNMDIVTMAMNLYSQGIDPKLDFGNMAEIVECVEACTDIPTHVRHPWVGELVYTAFSGSHQDAIRKGLQAWNPDQPWDVPYLPIDPKDIGRSYEAVVRVNSQSGKGGVAFALERDFGFQLPRALQVEFSQQVQKRSEEIDGEVSGAEIQDLFQRCYVNRESPWALHNYRVQTRSGQKVLAQAELSRDGDSVVLTGEGTGALAAMVAALQPVIGPVEIVDYHEHALGEGTGARAVCYVCIGDGQNRCWGVGVAEDTVRAALAALLSAVNSGVIGVQAVA